MSWKDVPIPHMMQDLPRDKRGFPAPFVFLSETVMVDHLPSRKHHFTIIDPKKQELCLRGDICPICGRPNHRGRWFVGGPMSALHENGWFVDLPGHGECMRYALQVCPYMAMPEYTKRIEGATFDGAVVVAKDVDLRKPDCFVAVMSTKTIHKTLPGGLVYVRPERPVKNMQVWKDGRQIEDARIFKPWIDAALAEADVRSGAIKAKEPGKQASPYEDARL